jgi:hypothetical protein
VCMMMCVCISLFAWLEGGKVAVMLI